MIWSELEDTVVEELTVLINQHFSNSLYDYFKILFDYIDRNRVLCRLLFSKESVSPFLEKLTKLFRDECLRSWCELLGRDTLDDRFHYYAVYHLQGGFAVISRWVDSEFTYPKEKVIEIVAAMDENMAGYLKDTQ